MNLDDIRWTEMNGGYRVRYDARTALRKLEAGSADSEAWNELWQELHHQGDIGEASYAAVPHLVRIHRQKGKLEWKTYAMVATIELARDSEGNPKVPAWLDDEYEASIAELARIGLTELPNVSDKETVRGILAVVALWKGARTYGRLLIEFCEDEIVELETRASGNRATNRWA